jgi:hypothetical protein
MRENRIALARYRLDKAYEKLKSAVDLLNNEDYAGLLGKVLLCYF